MSDVITGMHRGSRAVLIGRAAWQVSLADSLKTAYRSLNDPTELGRCKWLSRNKTRLYVPIIGGEGK
jgi:hypothetical protein